MLGILLIGAIAVFVSHFYTSYTKSPVSPPSFSFGFLVPSFLSGVVAIVRLGADEDAFLKSLHDQYGPIVYIPWPMQQYFVLTAETIDQVYRSPSKVLSFMPIRREMQGTVFGASFWRRRDLMEGQFYKTHARGFARPQLEAPVERFVNEVISAAENLSARIESSREEQVELPLNKFIIDTFFDASFVGLFGPKVRQASGISSENLRKAFDQFDKAFPLLASGLLPPVLLNWIPDVKQGNEGFEVLARTLQSWIRDGFEGLEKGVVRDMAQVALDNDLGEYEAGKMLVADFWALQANAPFIASQLHTYLLQAPLSLLADIKAEIDRFVSDSPDPSDPFSFANLSRPLPLLESCITETLRLGTTSFSIRDVEQPCSITSSTGGEKREFVVPAKSRLICATRVSHLDDSTWDGNATEWDGRRFYDGDEVDEKDENGEKVLKSKRTRQVWGFGGGISRCEGSTFATLELKALIISLLSRFDIELVEPAIEDAAELERIKIKGTVDGYRPRRQSGRVGMGAFQPAPEQDLYIKLRRRHL